MANMKILGPAKKLLRVRQQEGHLKRVQPGRGETVHVTIELTKGKWGKGKCAEGHRAGWSRSSGCYGRC